MRLWLLFLKDWMFSVFLFNIIRILVLKELALQQDYFMIPIRIWRNIMDSKISTINEE
jgi:hypothetical protein